MLGTIFSQRALSSGLSTKSPLRIPCNLQTPSYFWAPNGILLTFSERATGSSGWKGLTRATKSAFPVEKFGFLFFFKANTIIVIFQNDLPLTSKSSASLGHFFIRLRRGLPPNAWILTLDSILLILLSPFQEVSASPFGFLPQASQISPLDSPACVPMQSCAGPGSQHFS